VGLIARIFVVPFAFGLACVVAAAVTEFALVLPALTELVDEPAN